MRVTTVASVTLTIVFLSACSGIDAEQVRICRSTLPAVTGSGAKVEVARTTPGSEPSSLRVEFYEERGGERGRRRSVVCRFASKGANTRKADLVALSVDGKALSGASLYLLRHFYLDSPEGVAADPGSEAPYPPPTIPAASARLLQPILSGLPLMAIYGLLAAAYALVFGLVGRISLAFGALASVGGTAAAVAILTVCAGDVTTIAGAILIGVAVAVITAALHGRFAGALAISAVPAQLGQASLIASVGLFLALGEYLRLAAGDSPIWIPPLSSDAITVAQMQGGPTVSVTPLGLVVASIAGAAALGLPVVMRFTTFGREWRATAQDHRTAAIFGVDVSRLISRTLVLSSALAGLSGALLAVHFGSFGFSGGLDLSLKALAAGVVGGLGSVSGALLGGVGIGLFESLWSTYFPTDQRDIALFGVLIVAIIVRAGELSETA